VKETHSVLRDADQYIFIARDMIITRPLPAFVESFPMVLQREKLCSGRKKKEATWWFIPVSKWVLTPEIASGSLT
jgi:hypothetical protein